MPQFRYQRKVPFPAASVFDMVADVERYPLFLPGWRHARIIDRRDDVMTVEQTLGGWGVSWRFRTRATLDKPELIRVETTEHPFEHLLQLWRFKPMDDDNTLVSLDADYALGDLPVRGLLMRVFDQCFRESIDAFERRAHKLFD